MSMATNLPILHYFNKYTKSNCRYFITDYFNQNSIFSSDRTRLCSNSYISGSNWNFRKVLSDSGNWNLALGRDRGPWQ